MLEKTAPNMALSKSYQRKKKTTYKNTNRLFAMYMESKGKLDELPEDRKYGIFIPLPAVNIHMKRKINKMEFTNSHFTTVPFLFSIQESFSLLFFIKQNGKY